MPPQIPIGGIAGAAAGAAEASTAATAAAQSTMSNMGIKAAGLQSLTEATSILQGLKTLLYDIARNPLLAPVAGLRLETQIVNYVNKLKQLKAAAKDAGQEWSLMSNTLSNPRFYAGVGAGLMALGLRMKSFRDEVQKTQLELYKIQGVGATGAGGYGNAMGLTKQLAAMQAQYGPEFARNYRRTVMELQQRMSRENMPKPQQSRMFETITGLSTATGADYGRAVSALQDSFAQYGMTVPKAVATTDMIRDAWLKGDTAIGNLNDNIEAGIQLMKDFGESGAGPEKAREAMLGAMQTAKELGITVSAMMDLQRSGRGLAQIGMGGVQRRLELAKGFALTGLSDRQREILGKEQYKGMRPEEMMGVAQMMGREGQKDYAVMVQEMARRSLPMKNGEVDWRRLASHQGSIIAGERMAGLDTQMMIRAATAPTLTAGVAGGGIEGYEKKLNAVTNQTLNQFDSGLQKAVEDAITWTEAIDGWVKKMGVDFMAVAEFASTAAIALGAAAFAASTFARIRGWGGGGMMLPGAGGIAGGGGGGGAMGFGGSWTTTTTGGTIVDPYGNAIPSGRGGRFTRTSTGVGLGTMIGGQAANVVAGQLMGPSVNQVQGVGEQAAGIIPFGTLAAGAGRIVGGYIAGLFTKNPESAFDEELYKSILMGEKEGYNKQGEAESYKARMTQRDFELGLKYSPEATAMRALKGETGVGSMPAIQNTINVYVDSQKVAAHVQETQTRTAQAVHNIME